MFKKKMVAIFIAASLQAVSMDAAAKVKEVQIVTATGDVSVAAQYSDSFMAADHKNLKLLTIAGLDTKIETNISSNGITYFDEISSVININDRIKASDGTEFYGHVSVIPKLNNGKYTVTQRVTDIFGEVLSVETFDIITDTEAPNVGNFFWDASQLKIPNITNGNFIGDFEVARWGVDGVNDAVSGIDHIEAYVTDTQGKDRIGNLLLLPYNRLTHKAEQSGAPTIFPSQEREFDVHFIVFDRAGNSSQLTRRVTYTGQGPKPEPVGLYDGTSNTANFLPGSPFHGYRTYKNGDVVHNSRFRVAYRIPSKYGDPTFKGHLFSNSNQFNTNEYQSGQYRYFSAPFVYSLTPPAFTAVVARYDRWFARDLGYSLKLDPKIVKPPVVIKGESYFPKEGWRNDDIYRINAASDQNDYPTRYRVTVEPRSYQQLLFTQYNGRFASCVIQPNRSTCEVSNTGVDARIYGPWPNTNLPATILGHSHAWTSYVVKSDDHSYRSAAVGRNNVEIDKTLPKITQTEKIKYQSGYRIKATKKLAGAHWGRVQLSSVGLTLRATNSNKEYTFKVDGKLPPVWFGDRWGDRIPNGGSGMNEIIDIKGVPNGNYQVKAWVMDTYKNKVSRDLGALDYEHDKPVVTFTYNKAGLSREPVGKLPDIKVHIDDANRYIIKSVVLKGGPTADNVVIGVHKAAGVGNYQLETPRIFPSETDKQGYTIVMDVIDDLGNEGTYTTPLFRYYPKNVIALKTVKTLTSPKVIFRRDNSTAMQIVFNNLITTDGSYASGTQNYYLTVRRDSNFPVIVNGETITQGETKQLTVDFGDNAKVVTIPISTVTTTDGTARIMADFPQLTSRYK